MWVAVVALCTFNQCSNHCATHAPVGSLIDEWSSFFPICWKLQTTSVISFEIRLYLTQWPILLKVFAQFTKSIFVNFIEWLICVLMEQHSYIVIDSEGTTEKIWQFIMPLKSIYNINICFNAQSVIFEHCRKVKTM